MLHRVLYTRWKCSIPTSISCTNITADFTKSSTILPHIGYKSNFTALTANRRTSNWKNLSNWQRRHWFFKFHVFYVRFSGNFVDLSFAQVDNQPHSLVCNFYSIYWLVYTDIFTEDCIGLVSRPLSLINYTYKLRDISVLLRPSFGFAFLSNLFEN